MDSWERGSPEPAREDIVCKSPAEGIHDFRSEIQAIYFDSHSRYALEKKKRRLRLGSVYQERSAEFE